MKHRLRLGGALALVLAVAASCDPYWQVVARASLARPLSADCIRSALDTIAHSPRTLVQAAAAPPSGAHGTMFLLTGSTPYTAVEQYEYPDSTAVLETSVGRVPGRRFTAAETEALAKEMGGALLRVRDACGGAGMQGAPPVRIERKPV